MFFWEFGGSGGFPDFGEILGVKIRRIYSLFSESLGFFGFMGLYGERFSPFLGRFSL